jgi:hypothetical protein
MSSAPPGRPRIFANPRGWFLLTLLWFGYVLFFSPLWGPLVPWKIALSVVIEVGMGLGLAVGEPPDEGVHLPKRHVEPGERTATARAQWPLWRRVAGVASGLLLTAVGVVQSLGLEVDVSSWPLVSGLCLIVSAGMGLSLAIVAATSGHRQRPAPRRPPRPPGRRRG